MLNRTEIERVVDLQQRSYSLLRWMTDAVLEGFIRFDTAHNYGTFPEAAKEWILRHFNDIPARSRPDLKDIEAFSALFSTYLQNAFYLVKKPGKQLYSPQAHCFCPMCSWLIDAPNLKTKQPSSADKRRARRMKIATIKEALDKNRATLTDEQIEEIVNNRDLNESLSLLTYAHDLLTRAKGKAVGPAALVLWRGFAWTQQGSPKKGFELSVASILESEKLVYESILKASIEK